MNEIALDYSLERLNYHLLTLAELKDLIQNNDAEAIYEYGYRLKYGIGVVRNEALAVRYIDQSAKFGHPLAIARVYERKRGSERNSFEIFRKSASNGHAGGMTALAWSYSFGKGVAKNYDAAAMWYRKASELNHSTAIYSLGVCYEYGNGIQKSAELAAQYYKQSADLGNSTGMTYLASSLQHGDGVQKDEIEAVRLYRVAAAMNHPEALNCLGTCLQRGIGTEENLVEAVKCFAAAARQRDSYAQFNLGLCYELGTGVQQNLTMARYLFRQAAALDHPRASVRATMLEQFAILSLSTVLSRIK